MNMVEKEVVVKDLVTKSNLPSSDKLPHGSLWFVNRFIKQA